MKHWNDYKTNKPEVGVEVLSYSPKFIHPDFNQKGIRVGFLNESQEEGEFISAKWNNSADTYENDGIEPEKWIPVDLFEMALDNATSKLWRLLDDIDTASDAIKPSEENGIESYKRFYEYVMTVQKKRWSILTENKDNPNQLSLL